LLSQQVQLATVRAMSALSSVRCVVAKQVLATSLGCNRHCPSP
jgi:hypothetical protein